MASSAWVRAPLLVALALLLCWFPPARGWQTLDRVTIDNSVFMKNGKEFHFIGFNQYYMLDKARR